MDIEAPIPTNPTPTAVAADVPKKEVGSMLDPKNPSRVSVTIAGCGGCGINLARPFLTNQNLNKVLYFDTSMTNTRHGETANIVTSGDGSGSNRSQNARDIERELPNMTDEAMAKGDVAVVVFSLSGGSGSVIGPLLIREYARRKVQVIGVAVADTSYSVGAVNTLNTLKTLNSICKNNNLLLPLILLSNDNIDRVKVDEFAATLMSDLVDLLTKPVYEVDRQDRLNWINPSKAASQIQPGVKLLTFDNHPTANGSGAVLGTDSTEMVDSILILQAADVQGPIGLPSARLKKTGFYYQTHRTIVGKVTSDVSSIEKIIDYVERSQNQDRAQKFTSVERLESGGGDDLVL